MGSVRAYGPGIGRHTRAHTGAHRSNRSARTEHTLPANPLREPGEHARRRRTEPIPLWPGPPETDPEGERQQ